jgi:site-specific DNA-methyltransferase (adenine-specific)
VAHVITDPPYSAYVHSKQWVSAALTAGGAPRVSSKHKEINFEHINEAQIREAATEAERLAARWALMFSDIESAHLWAMAMGAAYVRTCIWDKVDGAPQFTGDRPANGCEAMVLGHAPGRKKWNGGGRRNVFRYAVNEERGDKPHPTMKPLPLMLELVELFTDPDEVVLDPYVGSGTTGVACLRTGRRFIGIEKDARYAAIARERLEAGSQGLTLRAARAGQMPLFAVEKLKPPEPATEAEPMSEEEAAAWERAETAP